MKDLENLSDLIRRRRKRVALVFDIFLAARGARRR